ncbi:recombination protein F [Anatilimnocola aggregata]|uniref:Recombination protein F n=1 Tax=Anatilimnocola aggregata TaxID=2528021 RepID=A0A517YF68_9BACT|nr:ATP-dependent endonuclease [Anatilimnocola aggregata]QDU28883.1 recombination protein F [Anatilimnocola aggregata]
MRLHKIEIQNFRLLTKVELLLEAKSTVIVGRNNSGKTSLTELFRRLLGDSTPSFRLEDFSLSAHEGFWRAFQAKEQEQTDDQIRALFPFIEVKLTIAYDKAAANLGVLGDCIIDLDPNCEQAVVHIRYALREGAISAIFADIKVDAAKPEAEQRTVFCRAIRDRVSKFYSCSVQAVDPGDATNTRALDWPTLRTVLASGFINAQRGLDDVTSKERDVLGKVLEALFKCAKSESADEKDQGVAKQLATAVQGIQTTIDTGFNDQLQQLLPAFNLFGYPGFADPSLRTETTLDVERLLTNHTKVHYAGVNGINLPEAYNGLGARNLIFILLKLLEFYKAFLIQRTTPGVHLIFIEEPEVHLHPQMQEVFIAQLSRIAAEFETTIGKGRKWPVQFVVTTHSSHMANKAEFVAMRYCLVRGDGSAANPRSTVVKDLRTGLEGTPVENLEFLHKYMTLTRCDLLFADKAVLIEGTSERLLLPKMNQVLEEANSAAPKLSSQYVSVVEVGGAYAHLFFPLVKLLELPTLVITDLDATKAATNKNGTQSWVKCKVSEGQRTSNACIKDWFRQPDIEPAALITKTDTEKTDGNLRIAYEVPETGSVHCGRSFEDAFILANSAMFGLAAPSEDEAWKLAGEEGKSDFALTYAIKKTGWTVPRYIAEGVRWLAQLNQPQQALPAAAAPVAPAAPVQPAQGAKHV